jgi:lipooligosaccharide transport system permease protein
MEIKKIQITPPSLWVRIFSVWYRHYRVYVQNFISNGFPPFLEPLFFLAGIGLGLGNYVGFIGEHSYIQFLAAAIIVPSAMFTSAFECSYGTFIRLEFDKVYDGMISASITAKDLLIGEMVFAGTKSLFFSAAVLFVLFIFGLVPSFMALLTPLAGFFIGLMFAALSLFITSYVQNINHFNFYFTGLLTPMVFFSGIIFPLESLPGILPFVARIFPLAHTVDVVRALYLNQFNINLVYNVLYMLIFILFFSFIAIVRLKKRLIS